MSIYRYRRNNKRMTSSYGMPPVRYRTGSGVEEILHVDAISTADSESAIEPGYNGDKQSEYKPF